jgi:3-hydroxyacyl-CoA dehydrogenase
MYSALNRAAIALAQQGVASIEDIDRAWMHVTKAPIGPLGALDAVGLDTVWTITDYWARQLGDEQLQANASFLKAYVDRIGMKGEIGIERLGARAWHGDVQVKVRLVGRRAVANRDQR